MNQIHKLGYTFNRNAPRVDIWRKKGGTHYINVPRTKLLTEEYVHSTLRQCGCAEKEIRAFLESIGKA